MEEMPPKVGLTEKWGKDYVGDWVGASEAPSTVKGKGYMGWGGMCLLCLTFRVWEVGGGKCTWAICRG